MSRRRGKTSLTGAPCVLPANHRGKDHQRADGKTWPEGQNWQTLIGEYFDTQEATGRRG